jgi:hypothetical protein
MPPLYLTKRTGIEFDNGDESGVHDRRFVRSHAAGRRSIRYAAHDAGHDYVDHYVDYFDHLGGADARQELISL